jgi:hypothetical protein
MVQSDALSCRPDFVLHEDNDNEDITMLPDSLFVNLIYLYLQQRITNCDDLDTDATKALKLLVQPGPTNVQRGLDNWTTETVNGKHVLFFKGKTIFLKTSNYIAISQSPFTTMKPLDTLMNLKPLILFDNTTGGPDFKHLSKIMSKDAEYVNSSK